MGWIILIGLIILGCWVEAKLQVETQAEKEKIEILEGDRLTAFYENAAKTTQYIKSCLEACPNYLHFTSNSFEVNIADPKSLGFGNLVANGLMVLDH